MKGKKTIWIEQVALNLLRIATGFLFWQHGAQKLFGFPGGEPVGDFFRNDGAGWSPGAGRRDLLGPGAVQPARGLHPLREMAWAYFQRSRPGGILAHSEWWRDGGVLLVPLPVCGGPGWGGIQPGWPEAAQERTEAQRGYCRLRGRPALPAGVKDDDFPNSPRKIWPRIRRSPNSWGTTPNGGCWPGNRFHSSFSRSARRRRPSERPRFPEVCVLRSGDAPSCTPAPRP